MSPILRKKLEQLTARENLVVGSHTMRERNGYALIEFDTPIVFTLGVQTPCYCRFGTESSQFANEREAQFKVCIESDRFDVLDTLERQLHAVGQAYSPQPIEWTSNVTSDAYDAACLSVKLQKLSTKTMAKTMVYDLKACSFINEIPSKSNLVVLAVVDRVWVGVSGMNKGKGRVKLRATDVCVVESGVELYEQVENAVEVDEAARLTLWK
jgi:hypothetical protein